MEPRSQRVSVCLRYIENESNQVRKSKCTEDICEKKLSSDKAIVFLGPSAAMSDG